MSTLAEDLARHVTARRSSVPPSRPAVDEAVVLVTDYVGVALGGSTTPAATIATEFQLEYGACPAEATLLGSDRQVSAQAAAFVNAIAAHSLELDDTDPDSLLHFGPPVVSAALAAAEACDASGADFLTAVVTGCEVMQAVSDGANPGMRDRGFHSTAVCGVFGATAAAAVLFGLDEKQTVSAFGAAGAHAAGLFEVYGPSQQKRLQPGPAAQNGIVAARLASLGFEGAATIVDGRHGLFTAFTGHADAAAARRRIAEGAPLGIEYKPYSCFRPIHTAIDAALALRARAGFAVEAITSITVARHPRWAQYHLIPAPTTTHEAQGSINHGLAVALVEGAALVEQFGADRIADPRVRRLAESLEVEVDESLPRGDSCRLRLAFDDGRVWEHQVDYPKGSAQVPLTDDERLAKLTSLAAPLLSRDRAVGLMEMVADLRRGVSARELVRALRPDGEAEV